MAIGYILDLTRNITLTNNLIHSKTITCEESTKPKEYKDTVWGLDNESPFIKYRGRSINHMILGIVGFGNAGKLMAKKANAFGMKILGYDPYCDFEDKPDYVNQVTWEELLSKSDVISVHCTLSPQTKNMFKKSVFEKMKEGSYFINTSRGELVVEDDMIEALNSGKLAGAAIDVTLKEPISSSNPLLDAKNLIITPHIAGSANDVQICGTNMVIDSLNDYLNGKKPRNTVVYR
jgi:phosphoglycerate dehydrogenase-like enzyme